MAGQWELALPGPDTGAAQRKLGITEGGAFQWELEPRREGKASAKDVPGREYLEREGEIPWFLPSLHLWIPMGPLIDRQPSRKRDSKGAWEM